jgi:Kyanoviridae DNA primase/helicase
LDIEDIIIISLVTNNKYYKKIYPYIPECIKYVSDNNLKTIFDEYNKYISLYKDAPNFSVLKHHIKSKPNFQEDTIEYLNGLSKEVLQDYSLDWLVTETEKWFQDQALEQSILEAASILQNKKIGRETIPALLTEALKISFDDDKAEEYGTDEELEHQYMHYHTQEEKIQFPDWPKMNKNLGNGISRKRVLLFTSGPNSGKTMHMINAELQCIKQGLNVLHITLEDPKNGIFERMDGNLLDTVTDDLVYLSKEDYFNRVKKIKKSSKGRYFLREYPGTTKNVNHIKTLMEELKIKYNFVPDVIGIDYFTLLTSKRFKTFTDSYTYVKSLAEEVRGLASETNTLIISGNQLNRCLGLNTLVNIQNKGEIKLNSVIVGDKILTKNGYRKITKVYPKKIQKTYRITLQNGSKIICSGNHEFPVNNKLKSINNGLSNNDKLEVFNIQDNI